MVDARALKELKFEIAKLLTVVCNLVLKFASVPKEWRWQIQIFKSILECGRRSRKLESSKSNFSTGQIG